MLNFIIRRSGEKAVIQLFVLDQTSKYIRYIPKYSCPKHFLSNLSPSLDLTIADDCPDLNDEQFLENLSASCFTKINFYCRSGEKAVIQLSVFDHMLSGQEEFEAEE